MTTPEETTGNTIPSTLEDTSEVRTAMQGIVRYRANDAAFKDLEFVNITARHSYTVQEKFEATVTEASEEDKIPLTNEEFLAWSRAKRGRADARGHQLMANELVSMCYLAWTTAVMLEELPDWIRVKCEQLETRADTQRERESDAAHERADKYDEIREEFEPHADECEGACLTPAGELRAALEGGDLDGAVDALQNGDFFLDIGAVGADEE